MRKCNSQEEIACIAYHEGSTKSDAYRKAYPKSERYSPGVVASNANKMFDREHVRARLAELQDAAKERNRITVDSLLAELEENRRAALGAETPQASAATAATMGKAKLLGLDKVVVDHMSSDGSMTPTRLTLDDFYGKVK